MNTCIELNDGFVVDFTNMFGASRLQESLLLNVKEQMEAAAAAVQKMRRTGYAKAHYAVSGQPEPVYLTRLPFAEQGCPNTPESLAALKQFGQYVRTEVDAVVFLGVGGSYLGSKVLFDMGAGPSWNAMGDKRRSGYPRVYFSGNNLDACQCEEIMNELLYWSIHAIAKKKKFKVMLVPISKSGSTLETIAAFMYFYAECQRSTLFDTEVAVVTDMRVEHSDLYELALKHGWPCFNIQEGVGGRFSVLSNPGLIAAAAIGMDIHELLAGAATMEKACQTDDVYSNPALMNAVIKYLAAKLFGCEIEIFMGYGERMGSLGQWYVQLLAESLGKRLDRNGNTVYYGRTPVAAVGTTDMHAQTQQHQDGRRNKIVQFVEAKSAGGKIVLQAPFPELSAFAKYQGLNLNDALKIALDANVEALTMDNRFNARYVVPETSAYYLGELFYFLMLSIAYEGELANVDAYNQPGVEAYKKIMKSKLGRD